MDMADILNCPERDRNIVILLDEMHVREDLVYDKHSGTSRYNDLYVWLLYYNGTFRQDHRFHQSG